jgi:hypothetical protein
MKNEDARRTRLVVVTLGLIGVPRVLRKNPEKRCSEAYKLPPEELLLNASHSRRGPEFRVGPAPWADGKLKPTRDSDQSIVMDSFRIIPKLLGNRVGTISSFSTCCDNGLRHGFPIGRMRMT